MFAIVLGWWLTLSPRNDRDWKPDVVHLARADQGEAFFAKRWPEVRAVADPKKALYAAFGLGRAKVGWFAGPRVWGPGLRALLSGHGVGMITGDGSVKARCLQAAGRYTLVAQSEEPPAYRYVSVEGPIVESFAADLERDLRPMARRYFGEQMGDAYTAATGAEGQTVFVMRPEKWRTVDYRKSELGDAMS